jgi:hypothetical protein
LLPQLAGDRFTLGQAALTAELLGIDDHLGLARRRAILPQLIDGILFQADQ